MSNRNPLVDEFMLTLEHPQKAGIERLRSGILDADPRVTEIVKWKAPTFGFAGSDRATMNLRAKTEFQLVLHRGVKRDASEFVFEDGGTLIWLDKDRALYKVPFDGDFGAAGAFVVRWIEATL
jgi:hypothetical protein